MTIEDLLELATGDIVFIDESGNSHTLSQNDKKLLIDTIATSIPKKPNFQGDEYWIDAYCPNCGAFLDDGENPCESCSQLIDWSEIK